jgi:chemotaxis protein methyltransferase CheR
MDDSVFSELADLALRTAGLSLARSQHAAVEARLTPLLRREGFAGVGELLACIQTRDHQPLAAETVSRLTSKETWFFREAGALAHLVRHVLPARAALHPQDAMRIWIAGCATGQEAYSLAMLIREAPELAGTPIELLATDLDADSLARTRNGVYTHFEIQRGLSVQRMLQHFRPTGDGSWQASRSLRDQIAVRQHNLLHPLEGVDAFEVIVCRNVLGELAAHIRQSVLSRLADRLRPGGMLLCAAGDTQPEIHTRFEPASDVPGLFMTREDSEAAAAA